MRNPEFFPKREVSEEKQKPERESGVLRIVGASTEEEKAILEHYKEIFAEQRFIEETERKKTPEELELIKAINEKIPEFVKEYGGEPLKIKPENIHLIDEKKLTEEQKRQVEKAGGASFIPEDQLIGILPSSQEPRLNLANHLVHEILHFNSFISFTKKEKEPTIQRVGLRILASDGTKFYLHDLDEALVAELTKRFSQRYLKTIPLLEDEIKEREDFIKGLSPEDQEPAQDIAYITTRKLESGEYETIIEEYTYSEERKQLHNLINELYERNKERFNSSEEVFKVFTKALFEGKLLDVGRLIEKTFGKGSFRKKAEETAKPYGPA